MKHVEWAIVERAILLQLIRPRNFAWQEIWQTSIDLFKVYWNDHLVIYSSLVYRVIMEL